MSIILRFILGYPTILVLTCVSISSDAKEKKMVSMKIVEEPSSFGVNYPYQDQAQQANTLKMRVLPSNFSGPPHLRRLYGKCFTKIDESNLPEYKYEFCPFSNITQHEQSLRWNPYSGVLGVWQEWEIQNYTFTAMIMREGDSCGDKFRSTRVLLKCGETDGMETVTEPQTCHYELVFHTPLVCHPHALLVYPTLSQPLRTRWDQLETYLVHEEITVQGYNKQLRRLFEDAGYRIPHTKQQEVAQQAKIQDSVEEQQKNGHFDSLDKCTEEYQKLKSEIEGLRALVAVYQGTGNHSTDATNHG